MSSQMIVRVRNLSKIFPAKKPFLSFGRKKRAVVAVNNISFDIKKGEIVGLLGPNGAGKTTTISMLLGILKPSKGKIIIFEKELEDNRQNILQQMNFSAAYINFPHNMKVRECLYTFARLYNVPDYQKKVSYIIKEFFLTELQGKFMKDLSSGQQARVYLSKAFVNNPKLLLLDEPTAFMDPDIADTLRKLILKKVKENHTTVVFTSHNMAEVTALCDRVIFLKKGKIIAVDTPEALAKQIGICQVELMIIDGQKRTLSWCEKQHLKVVAQGRYITIELEEKMIAVFLSKLSAIGVEYDEISINKPTLEDFFLKTAGKI